MKKLDVDAWFATSELAGLGPEVRPGVEESETIAARVDAGARELRLAGPEAACLRALVLTWHDHLDEAHALVQDLSGGDAAWVHGIVHRREPDYSNARYWFRRVGAHPAFEALAEVAAPVLAAHAALPHRLIRDGVWDPMAFVDAVSASARPSAPGDVVGLLQQLQRLEARILARHLADG